jgi:hypothetical protein
MDYLDEVSGGVVAAFRMDGIPVRSFPFLAIGLSQHGLSLRTIRRIERAAPLLLLCRGIEVGRLVLDGPVAEGTVLEVPMPRVPRVPLPVELRLSTAPDGPDLVAPWRIESAAAALSLLGPPEVTIEDLRLDHGILRGTARELRNGLLDPIMFARINGTGARMATVEEPVALPEGGCAFRFALPILPTDLSESGLSVDLHLIGLDAPVAHFGWTRQGIGAAERRLAELEARLRQMEEEQAAQQQNTQAMLRRQFSVQQERIDAFIAAAATLLLDRLAVVPGQEQDALRSLLDSAGPGGMGQPAPDLTARQVMVAPEDGLFGAGWHREEVYPTGAFRWMSPRGLLLNPAPQRPLAAITLEICHLYKAAAPALTAMLDDVAAELAVIPQEHGGFAVRIVPQPARSR